MSKETHTITSWQETEKQAERDWITENTSTFQELVLSEFDEIGRGFVLVNASQKSEEQGHHPYGYLPQSVAEEMEDETLQQHLNEYDPLNSFIVLLEKGNGDYSIHQVEMQKV